MCYKSKIHDGGVQIYKRFIKYDFSWKEIDKEIFFENYSFKFKVKGTKYHAPLVYYKDPKAVIELIYNKIRA